jgi:ABC-type branched-subunit amino acid transport system substrate-binding protein
VAVLLPFCAEVDAASIKKRKLAGVRMAAVQYYQGILLALDSVEKMGIHVRLDVFDTQKDSLTTLNILKKPMIKEMDLIIGPFFKEGVKMAAGICKEYGIYHIAPATSATLPINSPFLIKPNTEVPQFANGMWNYALKKFETASIYIISDGKKTSLQFEAQFKKLTDSLKSVTYERIEIKKGIDLDDYVSPLRPTVFIIPSNEENKISQVLNTLSDTGASVNIFGLNSWSDFRSNNYDKWEKYHVHLLSNYYIDYTDPHVTKFRVNYRERFASEPGEMTYKAYDQMMCMANAWKENSDNWKENPDQWEYSDAMHNSIIFIRDPQSQNLLNTSTRILEFKNYKLNWVY